MNFAISPAVTTERLLVELLLPDIDIARQHRINGSHVREVILPGWEVSVARDGKALLLVHGATFPATVAFELDYQDASIKRTVHTESRDWPLRMRRSSLLLS